MKIKLLAVVCCVVLLAVAGCGADAPPKTTSKPMDDKPEVDNKGNTGNLYATKVPIDSKGRRIRDLLVVYYPLNYPDMKPVIKDGFVVAFTLDGCPIHMSRDQRQDSLVKVDGEAVTDRLVYDGHRITRIIIKASGRVAKFPVNCDASGQLHWARPGVNTSYVYVHENDLNPQRGGTPYEKVYTLDRSGRRKGQPRYFHLGPGEGSGFRRGREEREAVAPDY